MKKFIRVLSLFVATAITLCVLPSSVSAMGLGGSHIHNFVTERIETTYVYTSFVNHAVQVVEYQCCAETIGDCDEPTMEILVEEYLEEHNYAEAYTGQNYHSGEYHYALFKTRCWGCKYETGETEWKVYRCPGGKGGPCIMPYSIPDVPEETY